jgi:hypothetical protein
MKSQSVTWMLPSCLSELAILEEEFGMISAGGYPVQARLLKSKNQRSRTSGGFVPGRNTPKTGESPRSQLRCLKIRIRG